MGQERRWFAHPDEERVIFDYSGKTPQEAARAFLKDRDEVEDILLGGGELTSFMISLLPTEEESYQAMLSGRDWPSLLLENLSEIAYEIHHGDGEWPLMADEKKHAESFKQLDQDVRDALHRFLTQTGDAPPNSGVWRQAIHTLDIEIEEDGTMQVVQSGKRQRLSEWKP